MNIAHWITPWILSLSYSVTVNLSCAFTCLFFKSAHWSICPLLPNPKSYISLKKKEFHFRMSVLLLPRPQRRRDCVRPYKSGAVPGMSNTTAPRGANGEQGEESEQVRTMKKSHKTPASASQCSPKVQCLHAAALSWEKRRLLL